MERRRLEILPEVAFPPDTLAYGINSSGEVVGYGRVQTNAPPFHALLWSGGSVTDLGTLGGSNSVGQGINDAGQVVGGSLVAGNAGTHAFLWSGGTMTDLGTLSGSIFSYAEAINNAGQIVGWSNLTNSTGIGPQYATEWNGDNIIDLGIGNAYAINDLGQVVGSNNGRATLWSGGSAIDLNTDIAFGGAGWTLGSAFGINDRGQIVGVGLNPLAESSAFLLTPVPEPSTWIMMILGFAGLGFAGYRRALRTA